MIWTAMGATPSGESLRRIASMPNYTKGQFQNIEHTPVMSEDYHMGKVMMDMMKRNSARTPATPLPNVKTDLLHLENNALVWFGHSAYLLKINGKHILVDPVFSGHASPVPFMIKAFKGSNSYGVADMPEIDMLVITHDHYDHLDYETVVALKSKVKEVVCSLGVAAHLIKWGYQESHIHELYWHESKTVFENFTFTAEPARHFSGRGITRNKSLWCAFALQTPELTVFIGGDSGYGKHFKEIGTRYNGFDIALLECGQYNPAWKYIHMMPEETVMAAQDIQAKIFVPVHWGKFALSLHTWQEPADRVVAAAQRAEMPYATPKIGEAYVIGAGGQTHHWWQMR
ncbi:MAG TPA: MBL fold metallo-hydrolase [Chitinophagales bacterium]|nr:MBL fold metallo-hydrolase [Chitinophagales bacterium]HNA58401.1 MBL fold metallo-hydrolase [Chitinophagales bacterium]HNI54206.1 MBL fold metallo-hydrolase [Chitinophagales bacterium]HNJ90743.1 MBL fold metallo-hydrolase [Chitinophagales bacterium]HNM09757.1 MBL fold metallo-hydrolase [Chitinophagales bacterium]